MSGERRGRGRPRKGDPRPALVGVELTLDPVILDKGRRIALLAQKSLSQLVEEQIAALPEPPSAIVI